MILGAGLLVACAAGAAVAGPYFPAGIVLAALVIGVARRAERRFPRAQRGESVIRRGLRAGTQLALGAMCAGTAAVYLVPGEKELVAVSLVLVVGIAAVWADVPGALRRPLAAVLALAALAFVGVCFGLTPVEGMSAADRITPAVVGVLLTAVLFAALLDNASARGASLTRLAAGTGLAAAVSLAALYQLGPVRLSLAPTSLRDALAAADATALTTLFNSVVVLATVPALLAVLATARRELAATGPHVLVVAGYALAAVMTLLGPVTALAIASTLAIGDMLTGFFLRNRRCRPRVSSDTVPP
ncbi:hypothetical protein [Haloechinothrix salitolerans]|uniref:Uncharacterized protein n=1 Tax=Haloechinothrix salitolerans TaxID=926830 RepID=A0ABW2C5A5_9PSEU